MRRQTVKELVNVDPHEVGKWDVKTLRSNVTKMVSAANKRIARMLKAGLTNHSVQEVADRGGFRVKGKNENQLRGEYIRLRQFLNQKNTTVGGYRKQIKESQKRLADEGIKVTDTEYGKLNLVYGKLQQRSKALADKALKYKIYDKIIKHIRKNGNKKTIDDTVAEMEREIEKVYEDEQRKRNNRGVSKLLKRKRKRR